MQLDLLRSVAGSLGFTMIAGIWAACAPELAAARTLHVTEPGQGGNASPYTSWQDAATNIQTAINEAVDGDTVLISNGTYQLPDQILVSSAKNNVCIRGFSGNPADVIIDANNFPGKAVTNRCIIVNGNQIVLEALTFSNGRALEGGAWDVMGGGLLIQHVGKISAVNNCRFVGNISKQGGGVALTHGTVTLSNCVISGNVASNAGGGLYVYNALMPGIIIDGGVIAGNRTAGNGGGIYIQGNALYAVDYFKFIGTSINSNEAADKGGGAYCNYNGSYFSNAVFYGNTSTNLGGGLYFCYGGLVQDSELVANQAFTNFGGGAYYEYGGCVAGSKLFGNTAVNGGGVYIKHQGEILNSILQENTATAGGGIYLHYGGLARGCLLTRNTASTGGGISQWQYNYTSYTTMVESCTIVSNAAVTDGGGLWLRDNDPYTVKNFNNIIWFNSVDSGTTSNVYSHAGVAAAGDFHYCAVPPTSVVTTDQGNRTGAPLFVDWGGGNLRLADGSPCINTGTNIPWMFEPDAVDVEGRQRLDRFSRQVDIGCYEYILRGTMFWLR